MKIRTIALTVTMILTACENNKLPSDVMHGYDCHNSVKEEMRNQIKTCEESGFTDAYCNTKAVMDNCEKAMWRL